MPDMAKVLKEYFGDVKCFDVYDYGYGDVRDYLKRPIADRSHDAEFGKGARGWH